MSRPSVSRAVILREYGRELAVEELPIPPVEPGAVLVRVEAATICGTDGHIAQGELAHLARLPLVLGHEAVGRIVEIGAGRGQDAQDLSIAVGDRIVWAYPWCGRCYFCAVAGQPTLCRNVRMYGWGPCDVPPYLVGALSEYVYVRPECQILKVSDDLDAAVIASSTCALRSVVHGFERLGSLRPGESVVVLGSGPVGLYAVALAATQGAGRVIVVGGPESRLEVAKAWGAAATIDVTRIKDGAERKARVLDLTNGRGADTVIECAGPSQAFADALEMVRNGGRVLVIGQTDPKEIAIVPRTINLRNLSIVGVLSGAIQHFYHGLRFLESHGSRIPFERLISHRYDLAEAPKAVEAMARFEVIKAAITP